MPLPSSGYIVGSTVWNETSARIPQRGNTLIEIPSFFIDVPVNLGFPFFGMWLSSILFGVLSLQTWRYFQDYPNDGMWTKLLIVILWSLDAFDLSILTFDIYRCAVTYFGNISILIQVTWMAVLHGGLSNIITFLVQAFFTRRVWILSAKNRVLTGAIALLSLVSLGSGIYYMIRAFIVMHNPILLPRFSKGTFIASALVADVLIAGAQCYYLARNQTGIRRTDSMLKIMMLYIVNTMLLTTVVTILELALWVSRNDATHLLPDWTVCRLYSNSLLAVLNTRQSLRMRVDGISQIQLDEFVAAAQTSGHASTTLNCKHGGITQGTSGQADNYAFDEQSRRPRPDLALKWVSEATQTSDAGTQEA